MLGITNLFLNNIKLQDAKTQNFFIKYSSARKYSKTDIRGSI